MSLQPHGNKYANSIKFLNCMMDEFEWENDVIPTTEVTGKNTLETHPSLIVKISGVLLEDNYKDIAEAITETPGPTNEYRANDARKNSSLSNTTGVSSTTAGVTYVSSTLVPDC